MRLEALCLFLWFSLRVSDSAEAAVDPNLTGVATADDDMGAETRAAYHRAISRANAHYLSGDCARASSAYVEAARLAPSDNEAADAELGLAECLERSGEGVRAHDIYRRLASLSLAPALRQVVLARLKRSEPFGRLEVRCSLGADRIRLRPFSKVEGDSFADTEWRSCPASWARVPPGVYQLMHRTASDGRLQAERLQSVEVQAGQIYRIELGSAQGESGALVAPVPADSAKANVQDRPVVFGEDMGQAGEMDRDLLADELAASALADESGWGFEVGLGFSAQYFGVARLDDDDDDNDWSHVSTKDRLRLQPAMLGRVTASLVSPWLRLGASYATNRGFAPTAGDSATTLDAPDRSNLTEVLDFVGVITGVPVLRSLTLLNRNAHFRNGIVQLVNAQDGTVQQEYQVGIRIFGFEVQYEIPGIEVIHPREGTVSSHTLHLFGAYGSQRTPRSIYLEEKSDSSGSSTASAYYSIPGGLRAVEMTHFVLGAGLGTDAVLNLRKEMTGETTDTKIDTGFHFTMRAGLGVGHYRVLDLLTTAPETGGDWAIVAVLGAGLKYVLKPVSWLRIGAKVSADMYIFGSFGVPPEYAELVTENGLDKDDTSLSFGTIDYYLRGDAYLAVVF